MGIIEYVQNRSDRTALQQQQSQSDLRSEPGFPHCYSQGAARGGTDEGPRSMKLYGP